MRILGALAATYLLAACTSAPPYDAAAQAVQAQTGESFRHFQHRVQNHHLSAVSTGHTCNPAVLFIHGTPGSWKAWSSYLSDPELNARAFMIAVDRPGFGRSDPGIPVLDLKKQAAIILTAARLEHRGPFLIVGHSYAGPIQIHIAQDFERDVSGVIMLAGAIDPVAQHSRWYHRLANTWLGRAILSQPLNVATREMLSLPAELEKLKSSLKSINTDITLIQGENDWLVPNDNIAYARGNLPDHRLEIIELRDQGHFIPWQNFELVKTQIISKLKDTEGCPPNSSRLTQATVSAKN